MSLTILKHTERKMAARATVLLVKKWFEVQDYVMVTMKD
jgi:hypothetical protein